jgi:hypothetical protein
MSQDLSLGQLYDVHNKTKICTSTDWAYSFITTQRVLFVTWNGRLSHDFSDEVEHLRMIDPDVDSGQLVVAALADSAGYEAHLWPTLQNL